MELKGMSSTWRAHGYASKRYAYHCNSMAHHESGEVVGRVTRLALEDGTLFRGRGFGYQLHGDGGAVTVCGEVVFATAMCGYQEAMTDPSYAGQILVMTAPMMGNYGINPEDMESAGIQATGLVIRELSRVPSNYRATTDLSAWMNSGGVPGIEGIDTRALTRRLRTQGVMRGVVSSDRSISDEDLVRLASDSPSMEGLNLVKEVSPREAYGWNEGLGDWAREHPQVRVRKLRVAAIDCGAKRNILRNLTERGCEVISVPFDASAADIRAMNPDGLFVSNGPGDPATVAQTIASLRNLIGGDSGSKAIPTFGICLGHQLLCLALGGKTYKLKFGHRGANQPVKNLLTGRVEITSQNHGFAVDGESIKASGAEATHINLNDGTLAGFRHLSRPVFAVQYHPEASPGPHDASYLFDCFVRMMETGRPLSVDEIAHATTG